MSETDRRPAWAAKADALFRQMEFGAYAVLGAMLAVAALLALGNAMMELIGAFRVLGAGTSVVEAVDRLLYVFMLIEILHTVRASFSHGGLRVEPFLIVGLIASIRRVLVITLENSQQAKLQGWSAQTEAMLHSSHIELLVMAALILAMVISIYLLHRLDVPDAKAADRAARIMPPAH